MRLCLARSDFRAKSLSHSSKVHTYGRAFISCAIPTLLVSFMSCGEEAVVCDSDGVVRAGSQKVDGDVSTKGVVEECRGATSLRVREVKGVQGGVDKVRQVREICFKAGGVWGREVFDSKVEFRPVMMVKTEVSNGTTLEPREERR